MSTRSRKQYNREYKLEVLELLRTSGKSKACGITVSMGGSGNCNDNAMMESFLSTLKTECVTGPYNSRQEARHSLFEYVEVWYNRQRRHSSLGYLSPMAVISHLISAHP